MNIRKCYIQNFGKFHEFEYKFSDGLNIINEMNGWGKSTLATFIKVMFYGFDNSNKRAISENERKKYFPWQGGKFGGNLEFEIEGKIYEIERFFGTKDKEDTFKLYNKITNCESNDYSENIGEEIFKIDRQAYERSTYIPQQNISIEINDSITSKLSNLLENENDINSSEEAIEKINSTMKEYKKIGNKGKISELENKINNKKRELEYAQENEKLIIDRNKRIEEIKIKIKKLEDERNKNQEKINENSINEKNKLKKARYIEICNELKKDEEEIEKIKRYFNNKIPNENEIKKYEEITYNLDILFAKLDELIIEDEEREKYEKLKKEFYGKDIDNEKIDNQILKYKEIENINREIIILKEKLENKEKIKKENNRQEKNKIIISVLIFILGIILGVFISKYLYIISLIGILSLVFELRKNKKTNSEEISKENLLELIRENKEKIDDEKNRLKNFLNLFINDNNLKINLDENIEYFGDIYEQINKIKNNFNEYKNLEKMINEKENKRNEYQKNIEELINYIYFELINYFNNDLEIDKNNITKFNLICKNIISEMKNKKRDYDRILECLEKDKIIKQNYEIENDIFNIKVIEEKDMTNELIIENDNLSKNITNLINQKSYEENEMNRLLNTIETVEEIESEIDNLEIELLEANKKYNILVKTKEYLIKSKEEFSSHYLKGMTDAFNKYINIINGEKINTNIDVKLNVKIQEYGERKEIDYLSTGYKDLIGICMRFALVEALFENEKPFIILDDPFVNLDGEKMKKAKELLDKLSNNYQVIYLICHDSRK